MEFLRPTTFSDRAVEAGEMPAVQVTDKVSRTELQRINDLLHKTTLRCPTALAKRKTARLAIILTTKRCYAGRLAVRTPHLRGAHLFTGA